MQGDTQRSVSAIGEIVRVIEQIDGFASSIAASIEEQAATVREIARNASQVSNEIIHVVENVAGVATAAADGGAACRSDPAVRAGDRLLRPGPDRHRREVSGR